MTTACAHPNIALVKYWGKQDLPGNLPASPNLSITLDTLLTETSVEWHQQDACYLNGQPVTDAKISHFLTQLRQRFDLPPLCIRSQNNFPTGAGLASSASGFAALIMAINHHAQLDLDQAQMSALARLGSASAARSLYGGFVTLTAPDWQAAQLAPAEHWPLHAVVAITSAAPKAVGSTEGMRRTQATSPFYARWLADSSDDFETVKTAIAEQDFTRLAQCAEHNCLKMHSIMLTSTPTLAYWNPATVACMDAIRGLRDAGTNVFFTIDAGPQVKAICEPAALNTVADTLASVTGVIDTITCALGAGARISASR